MNLKTGVYDGYKGTPTAAAPPIERGLVNCFANYVLVIHENKTYDRAIPSLDVWGTNDPSTNASPPRPDQTCCVDLDRASVGISSLFIEYQTPKGTIGSLTCKPPLLMRCASLADRVRVLSARVT